MHTQHAYQRRGFTLLETMAALVLLAAGLVATAQVLMACARQRISSEQWLTAQLEAANLQEHLAALGYDEVTGATMKSLRLSDTANAVLPGAELHVILADAAAGDPRNKRIRVEVAWPADGIPQSQADSSFYEPLFRVGLTAWKYPTTAEPTP